MINNLTLVTYKYNEQNSLIKFFALGSHENFYRDLKVNIRNRSLAIRQL